MFVNNKYCQEVKSFMTSNNNNRSSNKLVVPGASQSINQMKNEIADELGVNIGPNATARDNGSVGGEITRRLVSMAQNQMNQNNENNQNR